MSRPVPHSVRRLPVLLACVAATGVTASCGREEAARDADPEVETVIEIDIMSGNTWSAAGPAVDDGTICASGRHWTVGFRDVDGVTELSRDEYVRRLQQAIESDGASIGYTWETEMSCADGSGTITVLERPPAGPGDVVADGWVVLSGTGRYVAVEGSGSAELRTEEPPPDATGDATGDAGDTRLVLRWTGAFATATAERG